MQTGVVVRSERREDQEPASDHLENGAGLAETAGEKAAHLWESATAELKRTIPEGNFSAWFERTHPVTVDGERFVLAVPSQFAKERIESRYLEVLDAALSAVAGYELETAILTDDSLVPDADVGPGEPEETPHSDSDWGLPAASPEGADFHPKYSFDSFVIGASNRFAHAAALAVAEAPAQAYNPLFIYGGAGLGKTHLLQAIGRYVQECHPGLVIRYVSSEQFTNDFILALQRRTIPEFHRRFRVADILLVDDIQFIEGKERTQEEFFHTFNALHPKSQIIITSDRPPKKIPTLEDRLSTRFESGLLADLQPPDLETRLAILNKKAETERLQVPADVLQFIASRIQTNIRTLEGALIRVTAYASLTRAEVTLDLAQNVLQAVFPDPREARVTSDLVISVAAEYFDVTIDEICSSSRSRPLVTARQVAMYLCRELTDLSLPKIGERFGGRDHTTVLHATKKVRGQMQELPDCFEQVKELTTRIRQQAARA